MNGDYFNKHSKWLQPRTAECQSSCVYHVFYMIIEFCLVWLQLYLFLPYIGSRLQQLQDLIVSATDITVSEFYCSGRFLNVYLFGEMFLTDILPVHVCFVYLFPIN